MLAQLRNELVWPSVFLTHPITVESGIETTELVFCVLAVVLLEMVDKRRRHVSVLLASAHRRENVRSAVFHQPASEAPHWEDNNSEEAKPEGQALLRALNPNGVEMHVELGCEVTVKDGVDVLKMVTARILVKWVGLRVRSVPATTATTSSELSLSAGEHRGCTLRASHKLCEHCCFLHIASSD